MPDIIPEQALSLPITLSDLLASRDRRQARQQQWLATHVCTLIVLTVVVPGAIKDSPLTRRIFTAGWRQLHSLCTEQAWPVISAETLALPTGCEGYLAVEAGAEEVKAMAVQLESQSAAGRLWDIDVISAEGQIFSRRDQGEPDRRCLLCGQSARLCGRQRTHPVADLLAEIARRADAIPENH